MKFSLITFLLFFITVLGQTQNIKDLNYQSIDSIVKNYCTEGEYEKALPYLEESLKKSKIEFGVLDSSYRYTLKKYASIYFYIGKYNEAEKILLEAKKHTLDARGKEHNDYCAIQYDLALVYSKMGRNKESETIYLEVLALHQKNKGKETAEYALVQGNLAALYSNMGYYTKAEKLCLSAISITKKISKENTYELASNYGTLAIIYEQTENYKKAGPLFKKALLIEKSVLGEEHPEYATSLNNLSYFYWRMGQYEKVEPLLLEAKNIWRKTLGEKHPDFASCLANLAVLYEEMGRYEEAEIYHKQVLAIEKELLGEFHPNHAISLGNLSLLYRAMGKHDQAESLGLQVLNINKKTIGSKHPDFALSLMNLATLYLHKDKLNLAEPLLLEAQQIIKDLYGEKHIKYANVLDQLAFLYIKRKNYERVEELCLKSLQLRKKILGASHLSLGTPTTSLAQAYMEMNRYKEAVFFYKKALLLRRENFGTKNHYHSLSLINLATLYTRMGKRKTAMLYTIAAISANSTNFSDVFPELSGVLDLDSSKISIIQNLVPETYLKLADLDFINVRTSHRFLIRLLIILKKQTEENENRLALQQYFNACQGAMMVNQNIRNNFDSRGNKLKFLEQNSFYVNHGIHAVTLLNTPKHNALAFSFSEKNKSILLADAVKGNRARTLGNLPDSLVLLELNLKEKKANLKKQIHEATTEEERANIAVKQNDLNLQIDQFLTSLKGKYPKYHKLKYENISANAEDVQALLDDKTLFIQFFVTDSIVYIFSLSKNKVDLVPLKLKKGLLSKQIKDLRFALSNYSFLAKKENKAYEKYTQHAHWFYKNLLKPTLEKTDAIENLIIVSDGELGHLPFEAFLTQAAPQSITSYTDLPYLVKKYNISYDYSATLWKESLQKKIEHNNHKILACAGSYAPVDSFLLEYRSPYAFNLRTQLKPLPATEQEVDILSKNFEGTFLEGKDCNEAFFKNHAHEYGIIHLAMHGVLHPRIPIFSSMAFTENNDSLNDNFLQAHEIAHLNLNASLVVLSACETGYGKFEQGEGVISLARSFMYAGVSSLIVSLWQVNDGSTARIMLSFYENISKGMAKDAALRQAKLDYINKAEGIVAHPAFWSAFIQLGDSRPITVEKKGNTFSFLFLGAILLILLLFIIRFFTTILR